MIDDSRTDTPPKSGTFSRVDTGVVIKGLAQGRVLRERA